MTSQLHFIVQTLSGSFDGDFEVSQKLQDVIDKTFLSLDIKPNPDEEWELRFENKVLDPQSTIADSKILDESTLMLATKEGGGG